ncbi:hypothetical protein SM39_pSMC1_45 (plasmid) [Serratia marcescens SM39]|uniref:Uncharacterized protein n=1 Tax=Serratia marcescens SM39 TaxID=1334564 RepID=A0AAT9F670_SERMA|nr:hypothetical protein SM39_pSMC1_45 [Serratia marcescens SM39]
MADWVNKTDRGLQRPRSSPCAEAIHRLPRSQKAVLPAAPNCHNHPNYLCTISPMHSMQTLQNHFLLAMPSLTDAYFQRSLVYLCEHSSEGAMGLVVNIPVDMSLDTMLTKLKLSPPDTAEMKQPVLQGGPVHGDRGFVLHSFRPGFNSTLQVSDEMMVTTGALGGRARPGGLRAGGGYDKGWRRGGRGGKGGGGGDKCVEGGGARKGGGRGGRSGRRGTGSRCAQEATGRGGNEETRSAGQSA